MDISYFNQIPKSGLMPMGAIIGDICGSKYEGRRCGIKHMPETLADPDCRFTDDTVMTIACANGIVEGLKLVDRNELLGSKSQQQIIIDKISDNIQQFALKYPNAGYGGSFKKWMMSKPRKPFLLRKQFMIYLMS